MSDYQCPSCGGFCKKSGCERENVPPQNNGWAEYNALVDRILKGTPYPHIDDWFASRAALTEGQAWKEAIIDALVVGHIYTKEHETEPRKALHDLICWEIQIALDPAVSSDAQALIAKGREEERERAANICEELFQHYSAVKDTALLNGDIALSNAASGEPRACLVIATAIRRGQ